MLKRIFYLIAIVLIIIWAIGFFVYALGAMVHLILIIAILLIAFKVSRGSRKKTTHGTTSQNPITRYPR